MPISHVAVDPASRVAVNPSTRVPRNSSVVPPPITGGGLASTQLAAPILWPTIESMAIDLPFHNGHVPTFTQNPTGDGTVPGAWIQTGGMGSFASLISEDITAGGSPDDTKYFGTANLVTTPSQTGFFVLDSSQIPAGGNPSSVPSFQVFVRSARAKAPTATNDKAELGLQFFKANETDALTSEYTTAALTGSAPSGFVTNIYLITPYLTLNNDGLTTITGADWVGAKIRVRPFIAPSGATPSTSMTVQISTLNVLTQGAQVPLTIVTKFKKSADPDSDMPLQPANTAAAVGWRQAIPLDRAESGQDRTLLGSLLLLDPDTSYDVKIAVTEQAPGSGSQTIAYSGSVTPNFTIPNGAPQHDAALKTRPQVTFSPPSATFHVDIDAGDDAHDGTSASVRTATRMRALINAASGDQVWDLAPGFYRTPDGPLTPPGNHVITLRHKTNAAYGGTGGAPYDDGSTAHGGRATFYEFYTAPSTALRKDQDAVNYTETFTSAADGYANGFYGAGPWVNGNTLGTPVGDGTCWYLDMSSTRVAAIANDPRRLSDSDVSPAGGNGRFTTQMMFWRPVGAPTPTVQQLKDAKRHEPKRVMKWDYDNSTVQSWNKTTPKGGWGMGNYDPSMDTYQPFGNALNAMGDTLLTNWGYRAGCYHDEENTDVQERKRLWVRLPGGVNPNECYVWWSCGEQSTVQATPLVLDAPYMRVTGLAFRSLSTAVRTNPTCWKSGTNTPQDQTIIERCYVEGSQGCIQQLGSDPTIITDATKVQTNTTVDHCLIVDNSIWAGGAAGIDDSQPQIPWKVVKLRTEIMRPDPITDTQYQVDFGDRMLEHAETRAVNPQVAVRGLVMQYCYVRGVFNGMSTGGQAHTRANYAWDVMHNYFEFVMDNAMEPDAPSGGSSNIRFIDNDGHDVTAYFSENHNWGPDFILYNRWWRNVNEVYPYGGTASDYYYPPSAATHGTPDTNHMVNGNVFKAGGAQTPSIRLWTWRNTAFTNVDGPLGRAPFMSSGAIAGTGTDRWHFRGNILYTRKEDFTTATKDAEQMDSDYNFWSTEYGPQAFDWHYFDGVNQNPFSAQLVSQMALAKGWTIGGHDNILSGVEYEAATGPVSVTVTTTSGSPVLTAASPTTAGLFAGLTIAGNGIPAAATIVSVTSNTITISANATSSGTGRAMTVTGYSFATTVISAEFNDQAATPQRTQRTAGVTADLSLKSGSRFIDFIPHDDGHSNPYLPNICDIKMPSDWPGGFGSKPLWMYVGTGPDLGAIEHS